MDRHNRPRTTPRAFGPDRSLAQRPRQPWATISPCRTRPTSGHIWTSETPAGGSSGARHSRSRGAPVPSSRCWSGSASPRTTGRSPFLSLVGRRTGKPRPVSVAMIALDDRRYVGAPNGTTAWLVNLAAMDMVMLTIGREPTLAVRPTPLELGPERDAVIRAAGR